MCLKKFAFLPYLNKIYKPINRSEIKRKLIAFKSYEKNSWYSDRLTIFIYFYFFLLIDWCSDGLLIDQLIQCIRPLIKPNWTVLKYYKQNRWCFDMTGNNFFSIFLWLKKLHSYPAWKKSTNPSTSLWSNLNWLPWNLMKKMDGTMID